MVELVRVDVPRLVDGSSDVQMTSHHPLNLLSIGGRATGKGRARQAHKHFRRAWWDRCLQTRALGGALSDSGSAVSVGSWVKGQVVLNSSCTSFVVQGRQSSVCRQVGSSTSSCRIRLRWAASAISLRI